MCHTTPTALDNNSHGSFLGNGAYSGEGDKAAVIRAAVFPQGIGEVQVAVDVHGNPLILLNVLETWKKRYQQ